MLYCRSNKLNFGPGLLATLGESFLYTEVQRALTWPSRSLLSSHTRHNLGDHHRRQRKLLNPVFSIAHMRRMIPIFNQVSHRVSHRVDRGLLPDSLVTDPLLSTCSSKMRSNSVCAPRKGSRGVRLRSTCSLGWAAQHSNLWDKLGSATPSTS